MLLDVAMGVSALAAAAGTVIGFVLLDTEGRRPPGIGWVRAHGAVGIAGAALLAAALAIGPARGAATGTESFGALALALFLVATLIGPVAARGLSRKRKSGALAAAVHATIAVTGLTLLITYVVLG